TRFLYSLPLSSLSRLLPSPTISTLFPYTTLFRSSPPIDSYNPLKNPTNVSPNPTRNPTTPSNKPTMKSMVFCTKSPHISIAPEKSPVRTAIIRFIAFTTNLAKAINASINGPIAVITALNIDTANPKAGTNIIATIVPNVSIIGHKSWNNPNSCSSTGAAESSNESNALFNASKNGCILSISVPRISNTEETTSSTV